MLSKAARAAALGMLLANQVGPANAVAKELRIKGMTATTVSKQTIIRAVRLEAQQQGREPLKALRGKPKKQLTADTLRKRLDFARRHQRSSWGSVMFTDRKKFAFSYPGSKVHPVSWVEGNGERRANIVNHASVVNVYAGLTRFGLTKLHVVAGTTGHKTTFVTKQGAMAKNITASEYRAVLEQTLLPEGRRLFGAQGISSWVLQQDNDPTHKGAPEIVKGYNQKNGCSIRVLPNWPPNSPDLSLIENVWSFLQSKLDSLGCPTFQAFKQALENEAKSIDRVFSQRLFDGMQNRVRECLERKGDLTKH
jgi:DDE superfamily endonuclease